MRVKNLIVFVLLFSFLSCSKTVVNVPTAQRMDSGWKLISSESVDVAGDAISLQQVDFDNWYSVDLPATVMAGLRQNGLYPDIYYSNNIDTITTEKFKKNWWYAKEFQIENWSESEFYTITFEGINYQANIWLNGKLVAEMEQIEGPFRVFKLDITEFAQEKNQLAVEVIPPQPDALTIGFVDWNPTPPDNSLGLWRGVILDRSGKVSIENVAISSDLNIDTYKEADLTIDVELTNRSGVAASGKVVAVIDNNINVEIPYSLEANETKRFVMDKGTSKKLHLRNPRLWWPVAMGDPNLYSANVSVYENGELSDAKDERFGIRKVEDYTFEVRGLTHRGYKINGKNVLLKGGGWVDDVLLADSDDKVRAQVEYVKDMNMNLIRLEGFWGNSKALYDACEEEGILLMIGLSCQWEWTSYCNRPEDEYMCITSDSDIEMVAQSFQDQVKWGMNNPAIFLWVYGSDKVPVPQLEKALDDAIREYDPERALLLSCQNVSSELSGPSGAKMFGPYEYVTPIYWYTDTRYGGAYGFNTETGPGAQIPPMESIRKMLKPEDIADVDGEGWQFHSGRFEFQTLERILNDYHNRYWEDEDVEDFVFNMQMSNYEAVRAMFEAFVVKRNDGATGVVQWMLNSAWPEMVWQLYDWYLNPNGAYFGTKTANKPVNLIYNYGDRAIYLSNETLKNRNLTAKIEVYDINSNLVDEQEMKVTAVAESVEEIYTLADKKHPSEVYFLSMRLFDNGNEIADSFYWLSSEQDEPDFPASNWFYTPNKSYASFAQLKEMEEVEIDVESKLTVKDGRNLATVTVTNNSDKIAFFIEMRVVGKDELGPLPIVWSDNYVSLLPNETRTFEAKFGDGSNPADYRVEWRGFNTK